MNVINVLQKLFGKKDKPLDAHSAETTHQKRFEKWEDAIPYLGKPVKVCLVESPDVKGNLTGILLAMNGDKIIIGFLEINGYRWEYWKCQAENTNVSG